jgi:hypothetical protein
MASLRPLLAALAVVVFGTPAFAQRSLHWEAIDVEAQLDASGRLHVAETHTMVFTGDWNGGERQFDVRPRQTFVFRELLRQVNGEWQPLRADASIVDGVCRRACGWRGLVSWVSWVSWVRWVRWVR